MGLVAPLFLLGLAGLAVPWLLHRLNDRQAPVQDFPSDRFLEPTQSVSARQKRLRYLKLLLLRLVALTLLCLLFAQPLIKYTGFAADAPETLHLLVLDQSFSMRHGARWATAVSQLRDVLDDLPAHMPVQLVGVESAATTHVQSTTDREAVRAGVQTLTPGFAAFEYASVMRQLNALAERQPLPVRVHFFTDAQASAMPARLNDLAVDSIQSVSIWNAAQVADTNTSISAAVVPLDETLFAIEVEVARHGDVDSLPAQKVVLTAPGEDELVLPLPAAGKNVKVAFEPLTWPTTGNVIQYAISLSPADALTDDDSLVLPVQAALPSQVLVLDAGSTTAAAASDAWLYLSTALNLDQSLQLSRAQVATTESLSGADMVVIVDTQPLLDQALPELSDRLSRYLDAGGSVLYIINSSIRSGDGVQINQPITRLQKVDQAHPLALNPTQWQDVEFYAHQPLDQSLLDRRSLLSLLVTDAGIPVLLEGPRQYGKLMWLNAALNGSDNNLPVSPIFVPFLHSIVDYYLNYDRYPSRLSVGDNVKLGQSAQLLDPAGEPLLSLSQSRAGSVHIVSQPGIYTILDQLGEHPVSVNIDARESDTRIATAETLAAWEAQSPLQESAVVATALAEAKSVTLDTGTTMLSLTRWLLPLSVLLFLAEALYANAHLRVRRA